MPSYLAKGFMRDCAYALASMQQKIQSIPMCVYDVGIFLGLILKSLLQNIAYVLQNNHREYLKVARHST
ncbi:MAG: hypothetical protein BA873_08925 [Desulfobulbaceae bacterium C00003063]|nr:MAG: hypothetical protein BA873_08925 [Desulfobulbaceae bacterium C00003063]